MEDIYVPTLLGNGKDAEKYARTNNMNFDIEYLDDDISDSGIENKTYVVGSYAKREKFSTLWSISQDSGVSVEDIKKANPEIRDDNIIYPGQEIIVPIKKVDDSSQPIEKKEERKEEEKVEKKIEKLEETIDVVENTTNSEIVNTIDVPKNLNQTGIIPNYTNYEYFYGKWHRGSKQREVSEVWAANGKTSDRGIATIDDNYLVAVSSKFGKAGDQIEVILEDGTSINCIIADIKGEAASSEWGHSFGKSGIDIIEWESLGKQDTIELGEWKGKDVAKIINYGSYLEKS